MIAFAEESRLSPRTIRVNRPYRSVMCCGCQGVPAVELRDDRDGELGDDEPANQRHRRERPRHEQPREPQDLDHGDADGVDQGGPPGGAGLAAGRPQPLGDHRDPHDDVPVDEQVELGIGEGRLDPGGQDEHATHLHDGQEPVEPVIGVERRREPGEVHPRPPDAEEHDRVGDQSVARRVASDEGVVQLRPRRSATATTKHEVEEQLQGARRPVGLLRVTSPHGDQPPARSRRRCGAHGAHSGMARAPAEPAPAPCRALGSTRSSEPGRAILVTRSRAGRPTRLSGRNHGERDRAS